MSEETSLFRTAALLADDTPTRWFVTTYVNGPAGSWDEVEQIECTDEARAFAHAELVIRHHAAAVVYRESPDAAGKRGIVAIRTFRNAS